MSRTPRALRGQEVGLVYQGASVYSAHRVFAFGSPAICKMAFVYAGKKYKAGEAFPYHELGLSSHDMYGLWEGDRIDFASINGAAAQPKQADKRAAR